MDMVPHVINVYTFPRSLSLSRSRSVARTDRSPECHANAHDGLEPKGPTGPHFTSHTLLASTKVQILTAEVLQAKKLKLVDLTCAEKQLMQCAQVCGYNVCVCMYV